MPIATLLPIYTFAKRLGLHPLHFMGVDANIGTAASRECVHPIMQYSWQTSDGVSREELAQAIYDAEQELADYLGFWPAPTWDTTERHELASVSSGWWANTMYDIRGDLISTKLNRGKLISGGRMQKSLVEAGAAVVYTDLDGDTYKETATVTVVTSVTEPEEIAVYYPGLDGDDEWEIRPVNVTIAAGTATITFRREQAVLKILLENLEARTVAGMSDGNFLTTVDVYRKYHDPSVQIQLVWRGSGCCDTGCVQCGLDIQNGCMTVKDSELGIVTLSPGDWNGTEFDSVETLQRRRPDYIKAWYRSGYQVNGSYLQMAREFELAIAKLAVSKLDRNICSCQAIQDVQSHYNSDLRRNVGTQGKSTSLKVTNYELENCPFGTTVAGIEVWRLARRRSIQC